MSSRRERMESCVSVSDFSPLEEVLESVPAEEVVPTVPVDVHERDKEDSDEVFPDKISKGKNEKKRERTEADNVSPMKKKARESPFNAPTKKTAKSVNNKKTMNAKRNAECMNNGEIKED